MAQARGGFFGKIFSGLGKVFGPIVSGIGNAVSGIFGGAKKKATAVAHQAIGHAKNAAIQAIQTGDIRGAASSLQANLMTTKREAMTHANAEFERGKKMARAEATKRIEAAHAQYRQKSQSQYNSARGHSGWEQYGYGRPRSQSVRRRSPPRRRSPARGRSTTRRRSPERSRRSSYPRRQVPSYDEFYGAGFGKKHFKRLEREAHRHINRIYSHAKKQVGESYKHISKNGKKGIGQAKKNATKSINKVHKEGAGVFKGHLAAVKALMREDLQKKKMGLVKKRKGAGMKVGAGGVIDPRLDPKGAADQFKYGKYGRRAAGISVGAGVKRKRRKRKSSPEEDY